MSFNSSLENMAEEEAITEYVGSLEKEQLDAQDVGDAALVGVKDVHNMMQVELLARCSLDVVLLIYDRRFDAEFYEMFVEMEKDFPLLRFMALDVNDKVDESNGLYLIEYNGKHRVQLHIGSKIYAYNLNKQRGKLVGHLEILVKSAETVLSM